MCFVLAHFDEVSRSAAFEEMGRTNVELGLCLMLFALLCRCC